MPNYELLLHLSTVLIVPLLPAFILYKFLPSKTMVTGPFKGLNLNLTGAFGGYFLLVLISIGLTHFVLKNQLTEELKTSRTTADNLTMQIAELNKNIAKERNKYRNWQIIGELDSRSPESTKIFVDEENISINALGQFKANLILRTDDNNKIKLPWAVCFFNQSEGYNVIDLSQKAIVDSSGMKIQIKDKIKLTVPNRRENPYPF